MFIKMRQSEFYSDNHYKAVVSVAIVLGASIGVWAGAAFVHQWLLKK
jgi:hypothetical protein